MLLRQTDDDRTFEGTASILLWSWIWHYIAHDILEYGPIPLTMNSNCSSVNQQPSPQDVFPPPGVTCTVSAPSACSVATRSLLTGRAAHIPGYNTSSSLPQVPHLSSVQRCSSARLSVHTLQQWVLRQRDQPLEDSGPLFAHDHHALLGADK